MNKNILITSASISAVIGSACLLLSSRTSERKKHSLKRHTGRAMQAMGDVADDITSILKSL